MGPFALLVMTLAARFSEIELPHVPKNEIIWEGGERCGGCQFELAVL